MASPSRPTTPKTRRKPGRPTPGRGVSRDELLDAATQAFAAHGVAATTLKDVAAAVHATPALVHYYFGGKAALVDAVVSERLAPVLARATAPLASDAFVLAELVATYTRTLAANPWVPKLMVREVLADNGAMRERVLRDFARKIGAAVPARIAAEQQRGTLRADLDPRLIALTVMSMLAFPFVAAPVAREALAIAPDAATIERLIAHHVAVLERGVVASDVPPSRPGDGP
jgi:AcrR family transcriptional regulator